ncbi:ubiquitin/ISG15-conjugating enzyme E2 L6 isoform X3 [Dipodomys merriami]|uniref:ubiquitin/ISG15-conjugating enzyme E2 L6 isoform X3 n=1 Tax=Dipodomys merriami TaxID=94247 RepID=UPI003855ED99
MTSSKRVAKELEDLQEALPPYLRHLSCDDANVLVWHALLLPDQPPYHLRAFRLRIDFPREYPLKPPTIKFTTKIYHPNVDENGQVCLPLISTVNWKPHTKICQGLHRNQGQGRPRHLDEVTGSGDPFLFTLNLPTKSYDKKLLEEPQS